MFLNFEDVYSILKDMYIFSVLHLLLYVKKIKNKEKKNLIEKII